MPTRILPFVFAIFSIVSVNAQAALETSRITDSAVGNSEDSQISYDGRHIVFESEANNLVSGDTNGAKDIFVFDRQSRSTSRVSVSSGGGQANKDSGSRENGSSISADGRYVTFTSAADNLVSGDTNNTNDIFLHDRSTGKTTRISVTTEGTQANNASWNPKISADSRYVGYESDASNLVIGDTNASRDVFLYDRISAETTRISVNSSSGQGDKKSTAASLSADGRYIAFRSEASNMAPGFTQFRHIFVHDRVTGETTGISKNSNGETALSGSRCPNISADGRYITFESFATNLDPNDSNGIEDVFLHDRQSNKTRRISVATNGVQATGVSERASISADGRYVTFHSVATDLVDDDLNAQQDIFVHDRNTKTTTRLSMSTDGIEGDGASANPAISQNGRFVAFESNSTNLASGSTTGTKNIFLFENTDIEENDFLSVIVKGNGNGTVKSDVTGIDCGDDCIQFYATDTSVILTAHLAIDSEVSAWEGCDSSTETTCTVAMNQAKTVTATIDIVDADNDGIADVFDNCPMLPSPDQTDTDKDGSGNLCDTFPNDSNETEDADGDGMGDNFETTHGLDPNDSSDASKDLDGDGFSNLDEFKAGTHPKLRNSNPIDDVRNDFNGDARSDLFWRNGAGKNVIWFMDKNRVTGNSLVNRVPSARWNIKGFGDFDGNGVFDVLWRNNQSGKTVIYLMDNQGKIAQALAVNKLGLIWRIIAVGDFNGDGKTDIVWHNSKTGFNRLNLMDKGTVLSGRKINNTGNAWQVVGVGDANADGFSDLYWHNTHSGEYRLYLMQEHKILSSTKIVTVPQSWKMQGIADFNGDNKVDMLWRNVNKGQNRVYLMDGATLLADLPINTVPAQSRWAIVALGDYTGDAKADVLWRNAATGNNVLYQMDGNKILKVLDIARVKDTQWMIKNLSPSD